MNFESVFSLQLAKPFLVLEMQPFLWGIVLWLQKFAWLKCFFFGVLIVLFRLKLEDTSYIQVEHSTWKDKRTNSPVLHLHRALALHPSSGSTDFNLQMNWNLFQVLGPHIQFHSNSFICCYIFWGGAFVMNNLLPADEPTHTKEHKTRLSSSKPPLWVWMKSPIAVGSYPVTHVKFVQ